MHKSYILLILLILSNYVMDLVENFFDDFPVLEADPIFYSGVSSGEENRIGLSDSLKYRYNQWFSNKPEVKVKKPIVSEDARSLELIGIDKDVVRSTVSRRSHHILDIEDDETSTYRLSSLVYNNPKFDESYYSLSSVKMMLPLIHSGQTPPEENKELNKNQGEEYEVCYIHKIPGARVLGWNYNEKSKTLVIAYKNETKGTFIKVAKNALRCSRSSLLNNFCKEVTQKRFDYFLYKINQTYCKLIEDKENLTHSSTIYSHESNFQDFKIDESVVLINDIAISNRIVVISKYLDSRLFQIYEWNAGRWSEEPLLNNLYPNERKSLIFQTIGVKIVEKQYLKSLQILVVYIQGDSSELNLKIDILVLNRQGKPFEEDDIESLGSKFRSHYEQENKEYVKKRKFITTNSLFTKRLPDELIEKFLEEYEKHGILAIDKALIVDNPSSQRVIIYALNDLLFSLEFAFDSIKIREISTESLKEAIFKYYTYKIKNMKLSRTGQSLLIFASDYKNNDYLFLADLPGENEYLVSEKNLRHIKLRSPSNWEIHGIKDFILYEQEQSRSILVMLLENGELASFQLKNSEDDFLTNNVIDDIIDAGLILLIFILGSGLFHCCRQLLTHGFRIRVNIH